jgi:hypothetical protein
VATARCGRNVLAVVGLNHGLESSDLTLRVEVSRLGDG